MRECRECKKLLEESALLFNNYLQFVVGDHSIEIVDRDCAADGCVGDATAPRRR